MIALKEEFAEARRGPARPDDEREEWGAAARGGRQRSGAAMTEEDIVEITMAPRGRNAGETLQQLRLEAALDQALQILDHSEFAVLSLYFGLGGVGAEGRERIADTLGIECEKVDGICEQGLEKLRARYGIYLKEVNDYDPVAIIDAICCLEMRLG